jgi:transposase
MPFARKFKMLELTQEEVSKIEQIAGSRTERADHVLRAKMLTEYYKGTSILQIMKKLNISYTALSRCIKKALSMGINIALKDLPRSGRPRDISDDDMAWILSLACTKPKDIGYASELWTQKELANHIRNYCTGKGHSSLVKMSKGTICKILRSNDLRPHKVSYYLAKRDPDFDKKMAEILLIYKEVEIYNEMASNKENQKITTISCDEKPGIQAIANIASDLPPVIGKYKSISRDYEYKRLGTVSLLSGMDLHNGNVFAVIRDRHRSREFIELLSTIDANYPKEMKIRLILDNHSSHVSKETRAWLDQRPNRFLMIFTPTHASWLNIIETLFSKMARSFLRGIRVQSKNELKERIMLWVSEINKEPKVFRWKFQKDIA